LGEKRYGKSFKEQAVKMVLEGKQKASDVVCKESGTEAPDSFARFFQYAVFMVQNVQLKLC